MEERVLKLARSWNKIVRILLNLKRAWKEHMKLWAEVPKREIEYLPVEYQKFLMRNFNRSKFDIMLPRLVDYYRGLGGVEALEVKTKLPKQKKEKEK